MSKRGSNRGAKTGLKLVLGFLVYSSTIIVFLSALGFYFGAEIFKSAGPLAENKLITIERGAGLNGIAAKLEREGAIENRLLFIVGTRLLGAQSDLKAGEYEIAAGTSARDIMLILSNGKTFARRFTIREGLTSFEIVRLLNEVENLSGEIKAIPAEGSLLPNTYDYQLGEARSDVIARLQKLMAATVEELWPGRIAGLPIKTPEEAVILASIIEKETAVASERRRVAGVFINRLNRGIPLQTDPTVIYAITKGKHKNGGRGPLGRRLLTKDLKIDSPYNTYKYPGLPRGPIANPGRASIEAALNPETHNYIFFVADGSGGHVFAETLREHNENVRKWRKIRAAKKSDKK